MPRRHPLRIGLLTFLLCIGSGDAFSEIGEGLNLPMIDGVMASPPAGGERVDATPESSTGSDLNLGKPLDNAAGSSGPGGAPDTMPEVPPSSSISLPENVGKPPIEPQELPAHEEELGEPTGRRERGASSQKTPSQTPSSESPPKNTHSENKSGEAPSNQITQPADVPASSLNIMPSIGTQGEELGTPASGDVPLPSTLMIDPKGSDAMPPAEPILDGPPPSIPLLLPESQEPIKSDLFPMSGGSTNRDNSGKGSLLDLLGGRLGLPGGYLGLRLGGALVAPLTKKFTRVGTYGLLLEVRQGALAGLRFAYDVVPDFRSDVVDTAGSKMMETVVSWRKLQVGWALAYNTRLFFDMFHVSPSIGVYGVSATAPLTTDLDGVPEQRSFSVDRVVNVGLEVDAEKIIFSDSILRLWLSRFMTFGAATSLTKSTVKEARMTRAGADLFVKGPKVSRKLHLSYLGFVSVDSMEIVTRDPELLDPMVAVQMPFLGFGTSLAW